MGIQMTADDLMAFLARTFQQVAGEYEILSVGEDTVSVRLKVQDRHLRPGGTVSGPAMFGLADISAYFATLARIGPKALAVTTNCSIDFMRKPKAGADLVAEARLLKLGRQLSVTDVLIYSEGSDAPVARATLTYAIPPAGSEADRPS